MWIWPPVARITAPAWTTTSRPVASSKPSAPSVRTQHAVNIDGILMLLVRRETAGEVFWNWSTRSPRCPDCHARGIEAYLTPNGKRSVLANVTEWFGNDPYVECSMRPWRVWRVTPHVPTATRPLYVNAGGVGGDVSLEPETGTVTIASGGKAFVTLPQPTDSRTFKVTS